MERKKSRISFVGLTVSALVLAGCQTDQIGTKEGLGTVGGAVLGGLLGSQVGSGTGRIVAIGAGALLGGWLGNKIGASLDEADKVKLQQSTQSAIATGETVAWNNPDTGVKGRVSVKDTRTEKVRVPVRILKDRVAQVPPLEFIGAPYESVGNVNVRGGPGTDFRVVDRLNAGAKTNVIGKVQRADWYMISDNGAGSGFVHADLLRPVSGALAATAIAQAPSSAGGGGRNDLAEQMVAVSRTCRTVMQQITMADGKSVSEDVTACLGPNGWEQVS